MQSPHRREMLQKFAEMEQNKSGARARSGQKNSLPIQFHGGTILTGGVLLYDC